MSVQLILFLKYIELLFDFNAKNLISLVTQMEAVVCRDVVENILMQAAGMGRMQNPFKGCLTSTLSLSPCGTGLHRAADLSQLLESQSEHCCAFPTVIQETICSMPLLLKP